jgi:death-on-curing protein
MPGGHTFYPTLDEAVHQHDRLIELFGGAPGTRDLGLLESALARPRSGYYPTLTEQAAALMHSLSQNHPFVDGNKRVAFALTAVFLRTNGYRLVVSAAAGERFLVHKVIEKRAALDEIARWLERHMEPIE